MPNQIFGYGVVVQQLLNDADVHHEGFVLVGVAVLLALIVASLVLARWLARGTREL